MGFFDSLKANAGALKDKATDLAQTGVAESKRLAEIAKLKTANLGEEDAIKKAYIEIGKLYYEANCAAPGEEYAAACEKITAAKANIEANNDRIAELKVKDDDKTAEPEVVAEAEAIVTDAPAEEAPAVEAPAVEEATAEDFADEAPKTEE